MNRKYIIPILLLVLMGISTNMQAKKKKKHKQGADTTATVVAPPTMDQPPTVAAPPADDHDTSLDWITKSGLIADTATKPSNMSDFVLDSTRPDVGFYDQATLRGAKPFPIVLPNKNNMKVYKRLWREIDVRDSLNRIFATPGKTLIELLLEGVKSKKVVAYEYYDFLKPLSYDKIMSRARDSQIVEQRDDQGNVIGSKAMLNDFNPDSIVRFEIMEDVVFDKIRGRMMTDIISIAPVRSKNGFDLKLFYLNFSQARNLLAAREVVDLQRDIQGISYDDLFIQRNFKSRIIKEANPGDQSISAKYADESAQKKESDRIEKELRMYKKKLWKY